MNAEAKEVATTEGRNPMDMIAVAVDKGMSPEVISQFMDLQERWEANNAKKAWERAFSEFQDLMPPVRRRKKGGRAKYAPHEDIMREARPHLKETGLTVRHNQGKIADGMITLVTRVAHVDGHYEDSEFTCAIDPEMKANDSQKVASANSYAKRYGTINALNIVMVDEDDDGELGGGKVPDTITEKDVIKLREWLESLGRDEAKFCGLMGIEKLESLPTSDLERAHGWLKAAEKKAGK